MSPQSARTFQRLKTSASSLTYASQDKLPRLPIPNLEDTLERFQSRLEALLDENERAETAQVVRDFLLGDGPELQTLLKDYDAQGFEAGTIGSYVEEFWDESYLSPDDSVVLNLNPFFVLEGGPDPKIAKDQLRRAAGLCFASLKVASALKRETLTPDVFRGTPICMDQFKALFGSSRQPSMTESDDVHVFNDSTHVVVLCKNQFYYFSALWPDTGHVAVDEADIFDVLHAIQKHADQTDGAEASKTALGVLTSLPRSKWAVARQGLCESELNTAALRIIDSGLFVLVLDGSTPSDIHAAAANMLHGVNELDEMETLQIGSCLNRWHDKLQLIVCEDGTSGLSFEHSVVDGHTALRFVADVYSETIISFAESIIDLIHGRGRIAHVVHAEVERAANTACKTGRVLDVLPKKLVWELSESTLRHIFFAETALCDEIDSSDTVVLEFQDYGKRFIVANNMSPDAFVQMNILLAYFKVYGRVDCMYEPALTKKFFHGRTEAIRGATPQAKEFCTRWCDGRSTTADKLDALRCATIEHSRLTREAASGLGVDRHLFALKCIAQRSGRPLPNFFTSHAWKAMNHTVLSTSNCGNPALRLFGFGPVVPDGFGIGYIIKDDGVSFSVSSKRRQTRRFVRSLTASLHEMQALLEPITSIAVERPTLSQVQVALTNVDKSISKSVVSYGDIWGESDAAELTEPDVIPSESARSDLRSSSQYFARVSEHNISPELLGVSNIEVFLDDKT